MTRPNAPVPEHAVLSDAAKQFIATKAPEGVSVTPHNIAELRTASLESAQPLVEETLRRFPVVLEGSEFGGVPCTIVRGPSVSWERILFFCFGGALVRGSPFEDLPIAAPLAVLTEAVVVMPSYRLAPDFPFPAGADDLRVAYASLVGHHAPRSIAVIGESAGGNLALTLLQHLSVAHRPAAVVLMSPWCDLTQSGQSLTFNADRDPTLSRGYLESAAAAYAAGKNAADPLLSPLYGSFDASFPPFFITTGTRDLLLSDSIRLARRARSSGASVHLRVWQHLWHVFEYYPVPEAQQSLREIALFLTSLLPKPSGSVPLIRQLAAL